jgi:hypothetical protein
MTRYHIKTLLSRQPSLLRKVMLQGCGHTAGREFPSTSTELFKIQDIIYNIQAADAILSNLKPVCSIISRLSILILFSNLYPGLQNQTFMNFQPYNHHNNVVRSN